MREIKDFIAFKEAVRLVLYQNDDLTYPVSTYGGTMFLVSCRGRPYGVTAKHNRHDFEWHQMVVNNLRGSVQSCVISAVNFVSQPEGGAVGSDILDLAIIEFPSDITDAFFENTAFLLSTGSALETQLSDQLIVYGAPAEKTVIEDAHIRTGFAVLEFEDAGGHAHDPVLRCARAKWNNIDLQKLSGISGAPVYNATRQGLAGMVVRGGLQPDGSATVYYVDGPDIIRLVDNVSRGSKSDRYLKAVREN